MALINLSGATKKYLKGRREIPALDGVSLEILQGEFVAVTGPSGSGKSTLLHVLGLLDSLDRGEYLCGGRRTSGLKDGELSALRAGLIGFVFQDFYALQELSALENAALPLEYNGRGVPPADCLRAVELDGHADHLPGELSGGQQQRLAIARAMVRAPRLVLADEPTGNLDPRLRDEILSLLEKLNAGGATIVVVTHDPAVAARARRVITMDSGKVVSDTGGSGQVEMRAPEPGKVSSGKSAGPGLAKKAAAAINSLKRNRLRSALILACFAAGMGAITAAVGLTESFDRRSFGRIDALDPRLISVYPSRAGLSLDPAVEERIRAGLPGVKDIRAVNRLEAAVAGASGSVQAKIYEVPPGRLLYRLGKPSAGRLPEDKPEDKNSALLLRRTARALFGEERAALGKQVKIAGIPYTVVGVADSYHSEETRGEDAADGILVTAVPAGSRVEPRLLDIVMESEDSVPVSAWKLDGLLNPDVASGASRKFTVVNLKRRADSLKRSARLVRLFLLTLASLPVFLGAALVANTMLLSVSERHGEIGLRKALGASRLDIAAQFLTESLLLYAGGGAAGALAGIGTVLALSARLRLEPVFTPGYMLCAAAFLAAGGLVAGLWPALRAASIEPVKALRGAR